MDTSLRLQPTLSEIVHLKESFDWEAAARAYEEALRSTSSRDSLPPGELQEELAYSLFKSAFQSVKLEEFRRITGRAIAIYRDSAAHYRGGGARTKLRAVRCEAMERLLGAWITPDVREKRILLGEAWKLGEHALRGFTSDDHREYWKTFSQLAIAADLSLQLEWSYRAREAISRECMEFGEKAIRALEKTGESEKLAGAYAITANYIHRFCHSFLDADDPERSRLEERSETFWSQATKISERAALLEVASKGQDVLVTSLGRAGTEDPLNALGKALEYGKETKDKLIIGTALAWLAYHTFWKANLTEEPEEVTRLADNSLRLAREAKSYLASISITHLSGNSFTQDPETEHYLFLALHEADEKKRRELLRKAREQGPNLVNLARSSGDPTAIIESHRVFAQILFLLAKMETDSGEKTQLLEASLAQREEIATSLEKMQPFGESSRGTDLNNLADIESEMASVAANREIRISLLNQAIVNKDLSLRLQLKDLASHTKRGPPTELAVLARCTYEYGSLSALLWEITSERDRLERAATAFWDAAEFYEKLELNSRVAECYSRAGQAYDGLDEYDKATDAFDLASNNYNMAAQRFPALRIFSQDQAIHMQAWSEIENAKHHHWGGEYTLAKGHYEAAARLSDSTKQWKHLVPACTAWAHVEEAEGLSETEQSDRALRAFQEASQFFERASQDLSARLEAISDQTQQNMLTRLVKRAQLSRDYCLARITCEEARIFDMRGDDFSSSEKFGQAADTLSIVAETAESALDKERIRTTRNFVLALGAMTRAEAKSSSQLYLEASRLFQQVVDQSPNKRARMLSLGHSKFCQALESGTRFVDTKDSKFLGAALQHLDTAADCYLKAGVQYASEYAKASKLLFNAYAYLNEAAKEKDQAKKTKIYDTIEKILQTSAESYSKAGFSAKKTHVLSLLVNVREEHGLLVSLTQAVGPFPALTPATLATSLPSFEGTVGHDGFQQPQVQSNLTASMKNPRVGETVELRVQLVNSGSGPAQLVRLEQIIPEGFRLVATPEACTVEGVHLNLKGRRLDPLKADELRLGLEPKAKGPYELRPRLVYLDEIGTIASHELDPLDITVRERGVAGTSVGARVILPSNEYFSKETFVGTLEIESHGEAPAFLDGVEEVVPDGLSVTSATAGSLTTGGRIDLKDLRLESSQTHNLILTIEATGNGRVTLSPSVVFKDESGILRREVAPAHEILIHPLSPQMEFLAKAFVEDYVKKRLSYEQSGWRTLLDIVTSLKIPKSQAYGEVRYGHTFGRPMENLVRSGLVEYRTFRGKGRGGNIMRVRACYERDPVKRLVDRLGSARPGKGATSTTK